MMNLKPTFCGHWQGTPLGAMGGASLRSCCAPRARDAQQWPPTRLLGSDGTMLGDGEARLLADALNALPVRDPSAEAETIELLQVHLSEPVRDQLTKAGMRAGVEVLLIRVNGQGLPIR